MEFHIQCDPRDISRYCLTPGDHARAQKIAAHFDDARVVSETRGYLVLSGHYQGTFMTVCATGMGGPAVAIALEELAHMGADTFIRVGSCGVLQSGLTAGDVIISNGAVRLGGTANAYLPPAFPAVPNFAVTRALVDAATELQLAVRVGLNASGDAFYAPAREPDLLREAHILAVEMEADTLFIVGQYRGWRTGALFTSDGTPTEIKPAWGEPAYRQGEQSAIRIALTAMRHLAATDLKSPA
ncbi:MAG: nucleoside phosphorylase [Anaerolineae bacterium]